MKLIRTMLMGVTFMLGLLGISAAHAQTLPDGTYAITSFGAMDVSCISALQCFASYEEGSSFMYWTSAGSSGHFIGYWAEAESAQPCSADQQFPNMRTSAWGNVDVRFDAAANSWTGSWGYCEERPSREFNGARGAQSQNGGGDTDASMTERLIGSWLPGPDSSARRNDTYTFNPDGTFVISDGSSNSPAGSWIFQNAQLFMDGRAEAVPLEFVGQAIMLAGSQYEREDFNGELYDRQVIMGDIDPSGVFVPNWEDESAAPKVGDYALRYIVLGQVDSFIAGPSGDAGVPIYVEFWNETEPVKEDEAGNGYRTDIVAFEATEYEVGPERLTFHAYHPVWGDLYFSAKFDGARVAAQTSYELGGGGAKPANADMPIIVGDMLVKGNIFRDVELYLGFMH